MLEDSEAQLGEGDGEGEEDLGKGTKGPSARLLVSREDLERHFGYSLAEAAAHLGVCKTTIKRACRSALSTPVLLLGKGNFLPNGKSTSACKAVS